MVRVEDLPLRLKLLQVLRSAEQPVRRLFLDYHGLRLLWTWMNDNVLSSDSNYKLEVSVFHLNSLTVLLSFHAAKTLRLNKVSIIYVYCIEKYQNLSS